MKSEGARGAMRLVSAREFPVRRHAYRFLLLILPFVLLATLMVVTIVDRLPEPKLMAVFVVFVLVTVHREVLFSDETAISSSIVVVSASVVAFSAQGALLGPTLCGVAAGVHLSHVRDRVWAKLLVNTSVTGIAAACSAAVLTAVAPDAMSWMLVAAAPLAVLTYWVVDNGLIALVLSARSGESVVNLSRTLMLAEREVLAFSIGGCLAGLSFLAYGPLVGALVVGALLIGMDLCAQRVAVGGSQVPAIQRGSRLIRCVAVLGVSAIGWFVGMRVSWTIAISTGLAITFTAAIFCAAAVLRPRLGSWDLRLAVGIVIAEWPNFVVAAGAGVLASVAGVLVAMLFAAAGFGAVWLFRRWLMRRREAGSPTDEELLDALEFALLERVDTTISSR